MDWERFKKLVYSSWGASPNDDDSITIGVGYPCQMGSVTSSAMEEWVTGIDNELTRWKHNPRRVSSLLGVRLFTYDEYLELFRHEPHPDLYQYPQGVFKFLLIRNERLHKFFIDNCKPDEEGYFEVLHGFRQVAVAAFFFRPLHIPVHIQGFRLNTYISGFYWRWEK